MDKSKLESIAKKERTRLKKFLSDAPESTKGAVESLIEEIVDTKVMLAKAKDELELTGFTEDYQNGATQRGKKRSIAFDAVLALQKNYSTLNGRLAALIVATVN